MFPFDAAISLATQSFIRTAYGVLLLATLLYSVPSARRFFLSEKFGGYTESGRVSDAIQSPPVFSALMVLWMACAVLLIVNTETVLASFISAVLAYYFFIHIRWKSIHRGMGAPGFFIWWLGALVFFLEFTLYGGASTFLRSLVVATFRIDLAAIMLCSGVYKVLAGYTRSEGIELGLANPQWGFWWKFYSKSRPDHPIFRVLNLVAFSFEIAAGVFGLIPWTQAISLVLITILFLSVATQVRLDFLCEMIIISGFVYSQPGSFVDNWVSSFVKPTLSAHTASLTITPLFAVLLESAFVLYLVFLLPAYLTNYYNFLTGKSLPRPLQRIHSAFSNAFGIILWRVFTADLLDFFVRVYIEDVKTGARSEYTSFGKYNSRTGLRYAHVMESICLTSLFTTLRYHPSNSEFFRKKLWIYARTVPNPPGTALVFQYVRISKSSSNFEYTPAVEFKLDASRKTVEETILEESMSPRVPHRGSPIRETPKQGTYAS